MTKHSTVPSNSLKSQRGWLVPLATITTCLAVVAVPLTVATYKVDQQNQASISLNELAGTDEYPGALAIGKTNLSFDEDPIPTGEHDSQYDKLGTTCDGSLGATNSDLFQYCTFDKNGSDNASLTMMVGGSHIGQLSAVFRGIGQETKSNVEEIHMGGCRFPVEPNPTPECDAFIDNATAEVLKVKPDNVVLMATVTDPATNQEVLQPGVEDMIDEFADAGINVIAVRDNPRWTFDAYECAQVNKNGDAEAECGAPLDDKLAQANPAQKIIDNHKRVYGLDLTDEYCPDGYCSPIIGNVYVYMDDNHISKTYGSTTSAEALRQLTDAGWSTDIARSSTSHT